MKICEIFASIQGESSLVGIPMIFIRLTGCNLRCRYCDTQYSYSEGEELSVDQVIDKVKQFKLKYIEITGGEPLLQNEVYELMNNLVKSYNVVLETNGSVSINKVNPQVKIVMDIKTPGSGMNHRNYLKNINCLKKTDEVKFVIADREDYEWTKEFINTHTFNAEEILFSPVFEMLDPAELSQWIIQDSLSVRLNLQIHKYIFGDKRGV